MLLASCQFWTDYFGRGDGAPAPTATTTTEDIIGVAQLGPITGATIQLFLIAPDGSNVQPGITATSTAAPGGFRFDLPARPTGLFRVCVIGGTYTDEATGATVTNTLTDLCASVPGGTRRTNINTPSAIANSLLRGAIRKLKRNATPQELNSALDDARNKVKNFTGLTLPPDQVAGTFTPPDPVADPTGDAFRLGVLLGAYSQLEKRNHDRCGDATQGQNRVGALLADAEDGTFDGKKLDPANPDNLVRVQVPCGAAPENLGVGTGTAELLTALDEFAGTTLGNTMRVSANSGVRDDIRKDVATGDLAPPEVKVTPSQGLIAIDGANQIAYVPIYAQDSNGNALVEVVDLSPTAANPLIKSISLTGSIQPIASSFDSLHKRVYIAGNTADFSVKVYVVETVNNTVIQTIDATGLTHGERFGGTFGGIVANPEKNKVIVAGTTQIGIVDLSTTPPSWVAASVLTDIDTDSICLNLSTEQLFVSSDGTLSLVDTTASPLTRKTVTNGGFGTTDGCAFDNLTNVAIIDPEFVDRTFALNFTGLDTSQSTVTAPFITVPGLGTTNNAGEGPGGQAAINVLTHQGVISDEFGENYKLLQLPTAPFNGAPNNNGQPGTSTTADALSAFEIAAAVVPTADLSGSGGSATTPLTIRGDPNSLSIDPVTNTMYALLDTCPGFNAWAKGSTRPLFLLQVNLSQPVLGASPTAVDSQNHPLRWNPASRLIRMPPGTVADGC